MAEDTPETRAKYASFLFLTKDYANTQKEAQAVLVKDPNNAVMTRLLALSLYETNQNDKAMATMDNYFKNAKQTDIIGSDYAYYGRILAKAGKPDLAATNFEKALQMDPENIELKDDIADFYVKNKQAAKAIPVYQAIIATQPKNLNVYNVKLANALFENKQYDEAGTLYATVLKTNPTYIPALWAQAQIQTAKDADNSGDVS
jgi:tetratricopeptide (TPR) repeat protein